MFCINKLAFFMVITLVCAMSFAEADSIKLRNGSYFEGRIIEDTGTSIKMKLEIGIVEFRKNELTDITHSDEEANMAIEQRWGVGDTETQEQEGDDLVEQYLHKGKVKYQGRWISQEVYEVIQKEKEIKEKRYSFSQKKRQREKEKKRVEMTKEQNDYVPSQKPAALQDGPLPFSQRYKKFGKSSVAGNKTKIIAETENTDDKDTSDETNTIEGLNKVSRFGSHKTVEFGSTAHKYK